jgi:hypothetical protein
MGSVGERTWSIDTPIVPHLHGSKSWREAAATEENDPLSAKPGGLCAMAVEPSLRASPIVEGPEDEIRRYLAPDGCKFWSGEVYISSDEFRTLFEFKQKVDEKRRTLTKFRDININRAKYRDILHILAEFVIYLNSA